MPAWLYRSSVTKKAALSHGLWAQKSDLADQEFLLPLKSVNVKGWLEGPLATIEIDMNYINEDESNSIECSYEFPCDKSIVVGHLDAQIGDK